MATEYTHKVYDDGTALIQWAGKSTETKPTTGIALGSQAIEVDTGNFSLFDGDTWNKMCTIKEEE